MLVLIDSYGTTNYDNLPIGPDALHPSASASSSAGAQSFTAPPNIATITSVKFYLIKSAGSPTGNAYARLYTHSGTYGTSSIPTGAALASSAAFDVSTVGSPIALYEFTFSSPYTATGSAKYVVSFEAPTAGTYNPTNYVAMGADASSPSHGGNLSYYANSIWNVYNTRDAIFYVYGTLRATGGSFLFNFL